MFKALLKIIENGVKSGSAYIIADSTSVKLHDLADFISQELRNKKYGEFHRINSSIFNLIIKILRILGKHELISSIEFISKSWYYNVDQTFQDLNLKPVLTIPEFKTVIEWYKSTN